MTGLIITVTAAVIAVGLLVNAALMRRTQRARAGVVRLPPETRHTEAGDDTIAMLCLCCNGSKGPDCICTADCGVTRCQAADPEEARHG